MDNPGYTTLARQSGLMREMQVLAHNVANMSTTGFRREGLIFSEYVRRLGGDEPALSMAAANARQTDLTQGALTRTGGSLDMAIEGDGFFMVDTPQGERLTRSGHFVTNAEGEMVTPDGFLLLDVDGAPIFVPAEAQSLAIGRDGTIAADDQPIAQIGLFQPVEPSQLRRVGSTLMEVLGAIEPVADAIVHQGFLEESNVNAITEMARMIEVQRAYEMGQKFLEREDERIRNVVQTLGK